MSIDVDDELLDQVIFRDEPFAAFGEDELDADPFAPDDVGPRCRVCGCYEEDACETAHGHCFWIEPDLCSGCV